MKTFVSLIVITIIVLLGIIAYEVYRHYTQKSEPISIGIPVPDPQEDWQMKIARDDCIEQWIPKQVTAMVKQFTAEGKEIATSSVMAYKCIDGLYVY